jgi:rare lipoprotein A
MRRRLAHGLALALLVASLGAAQGPNNSEATPARDSTAQTRPKVTGNSGKQTAYQVGTASWYGEYFDGKPTASGEDYDMYDMTAAHPTLPLGSYVRVTNLRNGKAVVVRVNDRGPVVPDRIIDLSYGAAQALQFKEKGLQRVRLDVVKPRQQKPAYPTIAYNHPLVELAGR